MKIALLGDIALIGCYDVTRNNNVRAKVEYIHQLTNDCDIVLGNLESPLTTKKITFACKGVYLRSDPMNVETLKYMNVTHVTLANNHIFDYGNQGIIETKKVLEDNNIQYVGLGDGPIYIKKQSDIVAIEGFCCYSANGLHYGRGKKKTHLLDYSSVYDFFLQAKREQAFPIVSAHFGLEGVHYPSKEHVNFFRKLTNETNYILHGNHPHAIQGVENYNNSLLIYAQGDLCFGDCDVSSINTIVKQGECQSYIVTIELNNNKINNYKIYSISDKGNGILHKDLDTEMSLIHYSKDLNENYIQKRDTELAKQFVNRTPRNIEFFFKRLNFKYIVAFINGKIHSKKYSKVFSNYN